MPQFEVTIPQTGATQETSVVTVDSFHWHTALKEAFSSLGQEAPGQLMFDIAEDESRIRVTDTQNQRVIEIIDRSKIPAPVEVEDAGATIMAMPAFSDDEIGEAPVPAALQSIPISVETDQVPAQPISASLNDEELKAIRDRHPAISLSSGSPTINIPETVSPSSQFLAADNKARPNQYAGAGMTTEVLADAFMRAMDIYDYSDDRHAAMQFVMELALDQIEAAGAGVLLTDHNSPEQVLWYELAAGDAADTLLNLRIPVGQGAVGKAVRDGLAMNIVDLQASQEFENDHLRVLQLDVGPIVIAPIEHKGFVFGALLLYRARSEKPYTAGESSILSYLAHTAGDYFSSLIS